VRTKTRALAASAAAATAPRARRADEALVERLAQGGAAFGVPISLATALRQDPASPQLQLGVTVQMPSVVAGPLVAMFAVVNEQGRIVQQGRKDIPASA